MMAVFQRLELSLLERLLGAVSGDSALQLVSFVNQPPGEGNSIPDARMTGNFDYWFETKTTPNALHEPQIAEHYSNLKAGANEQRLIFVTPDPERPALLDAYSADKRVGWFNFIQLSDVIDETLKEDSTYVSEQARFLLRELQKLFAEDGLLDYADTVVVAARNAWGEYQRHGVYICQPGRSFRPGLTHMGFYFDGAIQQTVAKILDQRTEPVLFDSATVTELRVGTPIDQRIADAIEISIGGGVRAPDQPYRVFVLSRTADEGSEDLGGVITNATVSSTTGKPFAWTMGQRYTRLKALQQAAPGTTKDLEAVAG
jgi:hypothetical protein